MTDAGKRTPDGDVKKRLLTLEFTIEVDPNHDAEVRQARNALLLVQDYARALKAGLHIHRDEVDSDG